MKYIKILIITGAVFLVSACSSLNLSPAEFGWPIESVLKVEKDGSVKEDRYSIKFNTKNMFYEETQDSLGFVGKSVRLIRNNAGYYFLTAVDFKNVYVFNVANYELTLENKIEISESGLKNPAFNQRPPFIELLDEGNIYKLTSDGIEEGEK
jgi:hypothetical protein